MKKKLDAYRGRLSPAQVAAGINAALDNARRLLADASTLFGAGSHPSAAALAILSIEESGKPSILRSLALAQDDKDVNVAWKSYRAHTKKNVAWIMADLVAKGARRLDDLRPLWDETSDHPYLLDQVKQLGFYSDCLGQAHWSIPINVIDEKLAKGLIKIAEVHVRDGVCSEREIELWVKHMSPAWKQQDIVQLKQAIVEWYAEMQSAGLKAPGPNSMQEFVRSAHTSTPGLARESTDPKDLSSVSAISGPEIELGSDKTYS